MNWVVKNSTKYACREAPEAARLPSLARGEFPKSWPAVGAMLISSIAAS